MNANSNDLLSRITYRDEDNADIYKLNIKRKRYLEAQNLPGKIIKGSIFFRHCPNY